MLVSAKIQVFYQHEYALFLMVCKIINLPSYDRYSISMPSHSLSYMSTRSIQ